MQGNKYTRKQHIARALLMGRVYDWRDGTYCPDIRDLTGNLMADNMLDCDTLEVMNERLQVSRFSSSSSMPGPMVPWNDYDNAPHRPWEAADGDL